ncbi:histidine kinase N-terminal 7TM domain-containing protein [Niallia sp. Man26]|uniref:histidine kinase N-terminal 7TM domain-containing diguanylate cyclase n=1 Tax=Niallia sp. Man26 TaxID=2912824 RepID=UPI001EDB6D99|nr:histidine kinase N-terminal 7TM domain-containing protein [Niallia sp. Man26]UPO90926.1 diguanylate cyclase [Niallia sp. Man26]
MYNELIFYILLVIVAGSLSLFLYIFSYFKLKGAPGARFYQYATLFSSIFSFFYVFELSSTSLKTIKLWVTIEYLVMPFIPAFLFLMCLEYVGQKLKQWNYYILFLIPCFTIFMQATNDLHHLYYSSVALRSDVPFPILKLEYGPLFYVHAFYMFFCLTVSIITLLQQLKNASFMFRIQIVTMSAGLIFPIIANYFYLNNLSPYGIDLGPVSMSLSFIFHSIALLTFKMFNVMPIFRDTVFERMKEGVIVLNQNGVILDYNDAILPIIPSLNASVIGKPLSSLLIGNQKLMKIIDKGVDCDYEWNQGNRNIYHQVHFSLVEDNRLGKIGKIVSFVNITEKIEMQKMLKQLASIDGLTQVYNRTYFLKKAEEMLSASTIQANVSLIMFDIDFFKKINDQYGHEAGDIVLSHVAKVAKKTIRDEDIIGRYGGEEFIILLPETSLNEAYRLANVIRLKVSESFATVHEINIYTTLSLGVSHTAFITNDAAETIQTLMREADAALYTAKRSGRNNAQMFLPEFIKQ